MPATVGTHNLGSNLAKPAVLLPHNGAGNGIKEGRPATARVELGSALVERGVAAHTRVYAGGAEFVVDAGAGTFGALFAEDAELLGGEDGAPFRVGLLDGVRHGGGAGDGAAHGETGGSYERPGYGY